MDFDEGTQIDPATLPENSELIRMLDDLAAETAAEGTRRDELGAVIGDAVPVAARLVEESVLTRGGSHVKEEDLRSAIADVLRDREQLVLTEARLAVPGWTRNLGGFDLTVVVDDRLVVAETKWADGNLRESMWDLLKLASALITSQVAAGVAVYAAPPKQWQKPESCALLFEDRAIIVSKLIEALPTDWSTNLAGSSASPLSLPALVHVKLLNATEIEAFGRSWEIRTVSVYPDGGTFALDAGWPHGGPPATPKPYTW